MDIRKSNIGKVRGGVGEESMAHSFQVRIPLQVIDELPNFVGFKVGDLMCAAKRTDPLSALAMKDFHLSFYIGNSNTQWSNPATRIEDILEIVTVVAEPTAIPEKKIRYSQLLIDPWVSSKNLHYFLTLPHQQSGWQHVEHPELTQTQTFIEKNTLVRIRGRRRIGKTLTLITISKSVIERGIHLIYITATKNPDAFVFQLNNALSCFDNTIQLVSNFEEAIFCIWWLVESGVWIIIDEFQELGVRGAQNIQIVVDLKRPIKGKFIALGSHTKDLDQLFGGTGPLYMRGFVPFTMHGFKSTLIIKEILMPRKVDCMTCLTLVSIFNGIIGLYEELSQKSLLVSKVTVQELLDFARTIWESDPFYSTSLNHTASSILSHLALYPGTVHFFFQTKKNLIFKL
eukprot:TRINITY_DN16887_c0_g1_i1.p1 TRINITY_DN16887_c0_g1~~TRINITY_DN16887_c0_g1_i1.p1  ORF type:complete len:400 (-),score=40.68 TRINITY_DN16887_c0_g1_i1:749-1948(-)